MNFGKFLGIFSEDTRERIHYLFNFYWDGTLSDDEAHNSAHLFSTPAKAGLPVKETLKAN